MADLRWVARLIRKARAAIPAEPMLAAVTEPHGLIGLSTDAGIRYPVFQLGPQVAGVLVEINALLDAEHDPWGAAGWWPFARSASTSATAASRVIAGMSVRSSRPAGCSLTSRIVIVSASSLIAVAPRRRSSA